MYVVKRKELMKLIEKQNRVIYSTIYGTSIEGLYIGYYFSASDFGTIDLIDNVDCESVDDVYAIKENKQHFKFDLECGQREGLYDDDKEYVIYEKNDIESLIYVLNNVLGDYGGKKDD